MTLLEILQKVGGRSSDPDLETYKDEIQGYFEQAFVTLLKQTGENSLLPIYADEILPCLLYLDTQVPSGLKDTKVSDRSNVLYMFDIIPSVDNPTTFRYISMNELNTISNNPNKLPDGKLSYWTKIGSKVRTLIQDTQTTSTVSFAYVVSPDIARWADNTDLSSFGESFIDDSIELAAKLMRRQIGLEN